MIIFRQHNYAKRDYEGLSSIGKSRLRTGRDELAKGLRIYVAVNNYNYFNFALMHKVDSLYVEQFRLELLMAYYLAKVFKYDFND